ncbi:16S rRNA (adenine(1518)-N(6)/adenine(1519)-N(6))-dimethyltransferase RsmA [Candidatus Liberibacter africanus]|uniref:Ribosomal RNA small subunit methyltransferase A n=1 Tax=Candidatus Liberibacter africanus PTSAPSY TaxID=1277257 RepID=A0A0G3I269_LIBAF|nr:16S rRNA (adenine(1518)-N(6)/adenine(1519)-N(6))-dimethyltransferase RsmA [Candidatus Liberibacter africanus]AKK19951.1 dimethyladenosine transferase [Candidatus Liberibacter africanus PTSAPSY]QTP63789.1 16S rRNA (adenine(1518)-N(6)/adenine(1519)-N(6))-dimethyltransferase RsmA [Candidatus Liberibacter africanus]
MPLKNKPYSLKNILFHHAIVPHKKMGQNFLFDLNILKKIAEISGPLHGITVIEIGAGPGNLTQTLLTLGAEKVIVLEKDPQFFPILKNLSLQYLNRLEIIQDDALKVDFKQFSNISSPTRIIANLPYNIGTRLLFNWITADTWPPFWESLTLLFQKEVGKRITASQNTPHYGRLSVLSNWRTKTKMVFDIPPHVFFPPPKITSTVVHFTPRLNPIPCCLESLKKVTQESFGKRRKMLKQSLKTLGGENLLRQANIEPSLRAENISVEDFCRITNIFAQNKNTQ